MSAIRDMLHESVNRIFFDTIDRKLRQDAEEGNWPADLWRLISDGGYADVLASEESGGTWQDAYPIVHAVGRHQAPLPLVETIIGKFLLARAGLSCGDGPSGLIEDKALDIALRDGELIIDGTAKSVPWAGVATHMVISGRVHDKAVIARVDRARSGGAITPGRNIAKEPRDHVTFARCAAEEFAYTGERLPNEPIRLFGALGRAIAMVGACESALMQSIQYAKDRVQFARPIAKFQAVQHMLAVLATEVAAAKMAVERACSAVDTPHARFEIAVAKIRAGQAAGAAARIAHQVHGAFGMTYEHTLHFATRRLWSWRTEFGSAASWAQEIGTEAIRRGGQRFWGDVTARTAA